jgi:hypothetical protein
MLYYPNIINVEFDNIDYHDAPDFCDAYIVSASIIDRTNPTTDIRELTDEELEELNEDREFIYEKLIDYIY